jgi:membrane protease YdiL (CAAX protease family)
MTSSRREAMRLTLLIALCYHYGVQAFLPTLPAVTLSTNKKIPNIRKHVDIQPLKYRELDEEDDEKDPSMLKVKTRAPFGYNMKKAIQEQNSVITGPTTGMQSRDGVNRYLIRLLMLNQYIVAGLGVLISAIIIFFASGPSAFSDLNSVLQWSGGETDVFDVNFTFERLLLGIGASIPLLAFSNIIENSDRREFANINFATILMCLTLFGRRSVPPKDFLPSAYNDGTNIPITPWTEAMIQSLVLSIVTGFCEESVFRRLVPSMIVLLSGTEGNIMIPYIGQAILFGLGHAKSGSPLSENSIVVGLQTINGLGFGLLYILAGGDLMSCIIAHATFDFIVFYKTWKDANDQLEYAESMSVVPFPDNDVESQARRLIRTTNPTVDPAIAYKLMKRMFYLFDIDKNQTLSLSEVRKGIAYMEIERKVGTPPLQPEVDRLFSVVAPPGESRLTFPDFLRLISLSKNAKLASS